MPDPNYTDITVVLDRSGSMNSCADDTIGGLNAFVAAQAAQPGRATVTLVQFDTEYQVVYAGVPAAEAPPRTPANYLPRGGTALLDAIGRAMVTAGERLAALPEAERPGLVAFVIVTDGHENASREWTMERVSALLQQQQRDYAWQITFLGAGLDVALQAVKMGVTPAHVAPYAPGREAQVWAAASSSTTRGRVARRAGASGQALEAAVSYSAEELQALDPTRPVDPAASGS